MTSGLNKTLVKLALGLHNFSYRLSSKLAIKAEKGLHPKHRLIGYHQFFLDHIGSADKVLDVGCGNGSLAYDLAGKAKTVLGLDISPKKVNSARKNYQRPNLSFVTGDAVSYEFGDKFDVVVLSNVLEHIENRVEFLRKIKILAPKILIRAPMLTRDWLTLYKKELGVEYRLDKTHFVEYTPQDIKQELREAGLILSDYSVQFGEIWVVVKGLAQKF